MAERGFPDRNNPAADAYGSVGAGFAGVAGGGSPGSDARNGGGNYPSPFATWASLGRVRSGGEHTPEQPAFTPPAPTPWTVPGYPTPINPFMLINGGGQPGTGTGAAGVQAQAQQNSLYGALQANPYLNNTPGPMPQAPTPYQFRPPAQGLNLQSLMAMLGGAR